MEEIFETLREQIKGDFDQNNIIIILDKDVTKPKMLFHKTIHTAKVIRTK